MHRCFRPWKFLGKHCGRDQLASGDKSVKLKNFLSSSCCFQIAETFLAKEDCILFDVSLVVVQALTQSPEGSRQYAFLLLCFCCRP